MGTMIQDMRYALRTLAKSPGFTAIAVLTLMLGIGANTALFSVVNGVVLNPLPYPHPEQLVAVYQKTANFDRDSITYPNFLDWQKNNRSFAAIAAHRGDEFNMTDAGEPERLRGDMVSADFFPILGIQPVIGRDFSKDEDRVGGAPVVLISAGFWKRHFGSAPDVLGKTLTLNATNYEIIGVIPASFHFDRNNDVYIPIGQWNDPTFRDRRIGMGTRAVARLKAGVTLDQARAEMTAIAHALEVEYPQADKGTGASVFSLKDNIVGDIQPFLFVLLGAVAFVLLIACANVANLLLARATGRAREFAIRTALGASPARVVRQLLTESVLLSLAGGALGLGLAAWGTGFVIRLLPDALPRAQEIGVDGRVLLFTFAISLAAGILFGLAPALKTLRPDLQETLKEGGRGSSGAKHRAQRVFVVVEMALALVLLVGAGLMIRSLAALWSVNPGFNPHNSVTFNIAMPPGIGANAAATRALMRELHEGLAQIPGVTATSLSGGSLPMMGDSEVPFWLEGQPKPANQNDMNWALFYLVQPDYAQAMGIPLKRGRFLNAQDNENSPAVAVIDETLAKQIYPHQDPIGKRINLDLLETQPQIIGVVGHVKHWGLDSDATQPIQNQIYLPIMQVPDRFMPLFTSASVVVRAQGDPLALTGAVHAAVEKVNSKQVVYGVQTMDEVISDSLAARRFSMTLLGIFAGLALVLSSIGIYGVISYLVGQRTHEIGIRMALGAQRGDVMGMVLRQGGSMALVGVAIGIVAALGLTRGMTKMLYGISASDPTTFAGVAAVLICVALASCYVPARRAMRVDPLVALRHE